MKRKPLAVLALIAVAVVVYFQLGLADRLNLDALKAQQAALAAADPWRVAAIYFAVYVLVTALSLPGAALMTLAGGALFGLFWGTLIVSLASTLGATLAFLAARHLLRDWVAARFSARMRAIDDGIRRDGAFYLFTLRLIPLFPFFLVNLLLGLTAMKTRTYFWVSQLGMFAGTVVYVNAGTQLARLDSLAGIVSPPLLASFTLLGVFPLLARRLVDALKARRVYARWRRPERFDRNLVVIGAGAAGLVSAYIAAAVKARVTLVEKARMGGDCLNTGCVPSKALIQSARLLARIRRAGEFGIELGPGRSPESGPESGPENRPERAGEGAAAGGPLPTSRRRHASGEVDRLAGAAASPFPRADFAAVMARVRRVVEEVAPHDSVARYAALGVDVLEGDARLVSPWVVEITAADGSRRTLSTRAIVVATGARPFVPPIPGIEASAYLTSDTVWQLDELPRRLLVLGGGPIGCELAQAFARLGAEVSVVEMGPRLLPREDPEVSQAVNERFAAEGLRVYTGHRALAFEKDGENRTLRVGHAGGELSLGFDAVLVAVGRAARLAGFGLEELGIAGTRTLETNEFLQTRFPNVYAAGDVVGPYQFTHAAAHQAWYATVNALFSPFKRFRVDYAVMPWATFVDPEVARVGLNEQEAREQGVACEVTRYDLTELDRAIADGEARGFVKVLTVPGKDLILGATIVGEHAGELIGEFVLAMRHGLGLNRLLATIHVYPTWGEANKYAAGAWKKAHPPEKLLRWVERFHRWRRG